jgi:hypothetical protein
MALRGILRTAASGQSSHAFCNGYFAPCSAFTLAKWSSIFGRTILAEGEQIGVLTIGDLPVAKGVVARLVVHLLSHGH